MLFSSWWNHVKRQWNHLLLRIDLKRGKVSYGRQTIPVGKDGGVVMGHQHRNFQVRHRLIVRAKVFRAATGKYEDLGEIANREV